MKLRSAALVLCALATLPMLTACGDEWEMVRTDKMFPYGNQRTAGTGIAYVLKKMMPEKELQVETTTVIPAPVAKPAIVPIKEEEITKTQSK